MAISPSRHPSSNPDAKNLDFLEQVFKQEKNALITMLVKPLIARSSTIQNHFTFYKNQVESLNQTIEALKDNISNDDEHTPRLILELANKVTNLEDNCPLKSNIQSELKKIAKSVQNILFDGFPDDIKIPKKITTQCDKYHQARQNLAEAMKKQNDPTHKKLTFGSSVFFRELGGAPNLDGRIEELFNGAYQKALTKEDSSRNESAPQKSFEKDL